MSLAESVALVTGAGRGLGKALALAFAKEKFAVAVHYGHNEAEGRATVDTITRSGGKALLFKADVRSSADVNTMFKKISDEWGRLDVLVNNAGNVHNRTVAKMTDDEWRDVFAVNLDGPFYCTRAAIPMFRKQNGGSIINISSYGAARGIRGAANYAAAKSGLITFTKTVAAEEGHNGIRANAVMPGFHATDINQDVWQKNEKEIRAQHLLPDMPDRDEMAAFVVKVSQLKSVTGQVFAFESRLL